MSKKESLPKIVMAYIRGEATALEVLNQTKRFSYEELIRLKETHPESTDYMYKNNNW